MRIHTIESSVILYRSGTLTLSQAARHAGCTDAELAAAVDTHPRRARIDADTDTTAAGQSYCRL